MFALSFQNDRYEEHSYWRQNVSGSEEKDWATGNKVGIKVEKRIYLAPTDTHL